MRVKLNANNTTVVKLSPRRWALARMVATRCNRYLCMPAAYAIRTSEAGSYDNVMAAYHVIANQDTEGYAWDNMKVNRILESAGITAIMRGVPTAASSRHAPLGTTACSTN